MWSGFGFVLLLLGVGVILWICEVCLGLDLHKVQTIATILGLFSIPVAVWAFEFKKLESRKETALKVRSEFVDFMGEWTRFLSGDAYRQDPMDRIFGYRYFLEKLDLICMKILTNQIENEPWAKQISVISTDFVSTRNQNMTELGHPVFDIPRLFPHITQLTKLG